MNMLSKIALVMLTIGVNATLASAQEPRREATVVTIPTRYVDFRDPKAVADLDERLRLAAVKACDSGDSKNLGFFLDDQRCARQSWEAAVRSIHEPMLSQLHGQAMLLAYNR